MHITKEEHELAASKLDWDDLAQFIIDMEIDLYMMTPFLNKKEIKKFEEVIAIYEEEKTKRVKNSITYEALLFDD